MVGVDENMLPLCIVQSPRLRVMVHAGLSLNIATGAVVAVPWEWELDWNWVVFATDLQHMHS